MERHGFVALASAAAKASTLVALPARAQPPLLPVIGFLGATAPDPEIVAWFLEGLAAAGYSDGRNVALQVRWAHNQETRLPALVAELLRHDAALPRRCQPKPPAALAG